MSRPVQMRYSLLAVCLALAACAADSDTATDRSASGPDDPALRNTAPEISGTPERDAVVGTRWQFEPAAADADGDALQFQIRAAPPWTAFDPATGRLEGMPGEGDVATWGGIVISVTDGLASASLPEFAIEVRARESANGSATLSWTPPTERIDGSPIGPLAGYRVLYGRGSLQYDWSTEIDNPSITRFVVGNLTPGTWYFAVTVITTDGLQSAPSAEVSKKIEG